MIVSLVATHTTHTRTGGDCVDQDRHGPVFDCCYTRAPVIHHRLREQTPDLVVERYRHHDQLDDGHPTNVISPLGPMVPRVSLSWILPHRGADFCGRWLSRYEAGELSRTTQGRIKFVLNTVLPNTFPPPDDLFND